MTIGISGGSIYHCCMPESCGNFDSDSEYRVVGRSIQPFRDHLKVILHYTRINIDKYPQVQHGILLDRNNNVACRLNMVRCHYCLNIVCRTNTQAHSANCLGLRHHLEQMENPPVGLSEEWYYNV